MKRVVYENITRNFDIFEFLDDNNEIRAGATNQSKIQAPNEGDDEMSDELEFEIDDDANHLENLYFETDQANRRERPPITVGQDPILDLQDNEEEAGTVSSVEQPGYLKRGSTQATAVEGIVVKQESSI